MRASIWKWLPHLNKRIAINIEDNVNLMAGFDQLKFSTSRPLGYAETDMYNVKSGALITDRDACRHLIVVLHSLSGAQSVESGPNRELSDAHPKPSIAVAHYAGTAELDGCRSF